MRSSCLKTDRIVEKGDAGWDPSLEAPSPPVQHPDGAGHGVALVQGFHRPQNIGVKKEDPWTGRPRHLCARSASSFGVFALGVVAALPFHLRISTFPHCNPKGIKKPTQNQPPSASRCAPVPAASPASTLLAGIRGAIASWVQFP